MLYFNIEYHTKDFFFHDFDKAWNKQLVIIDSSSTKWVIKSG